jgi:hypothetical protein
MALVKIVCDPVPVVVIQKQIARIYPLSSQWTWEALPHGEDAFLIGFPSFEDLDRVDGIQMGVPNYEAQFTVNA